MLNVCEASGLRIRENSHSQAGSFVSLWMTSSIFLETALENQKNSRKSGFIQPATFAMPASGEFAHY